MKNKRELVIGIFVVITTALTMIFSLNYTHKMLTENAQKTTTPIIINKKDPKFKIQNWGMNRSKTKKQALVERMTYN